MINLRLAEYNLETGRFERFLELGKDFIFGGNFVGIYPQSLWQAIKKSTIFSLNNFYKFDKDQKDPLNRFDGLFDGRTYGNGRFVLTTGQTITHLYSETENLIFEDDVIIDDNIQSSNCGKTILASCLKIFHLWHINSIKRCSSFTPIGNLHKNPELWEKVK